ncbi:PaaI family thioesterase [Bacillus fonticola]|uniref:PaaI family thioesterase n=1 Tax=Bacillus fonticola TaxID=2728853 RepID=UPI001473546E|nr:PaaI family thioesterase [Bacillus fonticola]
MELEQITSFLQGASEEEQLVLQQVIEGLRRKRSGEYRSSIASVLLLEKEFDLEERIAKMRMPLTTLTQNSLSIAHGGLTATLLDTVMGTYANLLLKGKGKAVTSEFQIHYTAAGTGDYLDATATCIHAGNTRLVMEGRAFREDGTLVAFATGSFHVLVDN